MTARARPFVGRAAELEVLQQALQGAAAGHARLVLVSGEPGIGKSRLVSEFVATAEARDTRVLFGRCDEEGLIPYQPIVEALRAYIADGANDDLGLELGPTWNDLARLVPGLADELGESPARAVRSLESDRYQLFESVVTLLERVSRDHALLLILEDLHWSDQPLLLLLRHLFYSRRLRRVLIVATYREADLGDAHPLRRLIAEIGYAETCTRLHLAGLSPEEVAALVDAASPVADRGALLRSVVERTDGNPFFAIQLIDHLGDTADLAADLGDTAVPAGVGELVAVRIARLSDGAREALSTAAVIGYTVEIALLRRSMAVDAGELLDAIGEATHAGLLEDLPGVAPAARFAHAIVRDAVYSQLSPGERARIHRRVALALEEIAAARADEPVEQLAHHFAQSAVLGGGEKAVQYARRAGDRALQALAFPEAAANFETALRLHELQESPDPGERFELLFSLGRAQSGVEGTDASQDQDRSIATLTEAARTARRMGNHQLMVRAAVEGTGHWLESWGTPWDPRRVSLIQLQEEVLAALPSDATRDRLLVAEHLSMLYQASAKVEQQQKYATQAAAIAECLADRESLARGRLLQAKLLMESGRYEEASVSLNSVLDLATTPETAEFALQAVFLDSLCATRLGDYQQIRGTTQRLGAQAADLGDTLMSTWVEVFSAGGLAILAGNLQLALKKNSEAAAIGRQLGSRHISVNALGQRFHLAHLAARWESVARAWERWLETGTLWSRVLVAWSMARAGREPASAGEMLEFDVAQLPRNRIQMSTLAHAAEAVAILGHAERARPLYEALQPFAAYGWDGGSLLFAYGSVSRPLGMLATLTEDWDRAEADFATALQFNERMRHRPATAETTFRYAQMLLARDRGDDRARATGMLESALADAQAMGLVALEADVSRVRNGLDGRTPALAATRPALPDGLSEREVDVLRLLAQGRRNREIAEQLVISSATVARHVSNILAKTGTRNRGEAMRYAIAHGLVDP